jgi:hypothetical protein
VAGYFENVLGVKKSCLYRSRGLRFVREFLISIKRCRPPLDVVGFTKEEECMTEKSGNRNLGWRDSEEHKTVDGGKKRRFVVSCARKTRRERNVKGVTSAASR